MTKDTKIKYGWYSVLLTQTGQVPGSGSDCMPPSAVISFN